MPDSTAATVTPRGRERGSRTSALARTRAMVRRVWPLVGVICLALAGVGAIIALQAGTRRALHAQETLRSFEAGLHQIQDIPWKLAQPPNPGRAAIAAQLAAGKQKVRSELKAAGGGLTSRAMHAIELELGRNFSASERILALIAQGKVSDQATTAANDAATSANDAIEQAVRSAGQAASDQAGASLTRTTVGFSGLLVALVVGFALLYRLSIKAREDRVRRAEAERASRAKSEFLSRVSHELRTPLNSILGFTQIVAKSELEERQRGNIGRVARAGRHLLELINEVLDISRIESGELRLSLEPVGVSAVVGEVIDLVGPQADAREVTVIADPSCSQAWVRADVQRIKQVLLNLVSNAVKYNREGGHVTISVAQGARDQVELVVADTGPGIVAEKLGLIFSPFERLGAEATTIEGTGLGLALAKGFVEAMGGSLTVQSTAGVGSAFTVELAAAAPPPKPERESATPDFAAGSKPRRRKVLYIEDNVSNLDLVQEVFADRPDIGLLTAVQGRLGVSLAHEHRPDVVLLDLNLPDLSGEKVLERLRGDAATAGIPVIVVTADATDGQREHVLARGATAYLTKPIDIEELLRVVDEALLAPAGAAA